MTHFPTRDERAPRHRPGLTLRARPASLLALLALLLVLALVLTATIRSPEKDDIAWLLYVARKWLGGQRLYVDLVEVNPPLIIWLYAIPARIAIWLAVPPKLVAIPFFASLVLGAAWWSACLLRGQGPLFARRAPVFAVIGIVLLVLPGVEFGQREHLMTAAILPYICVLATWLNGGTTRRSTGVAAGIVAGLGCALKPTYALAFLLPELLGLLRGRKLIRPAPVAAVLAALAYAAGIVMLCPAYLEHAVPLALALYGGTDQPLPALLRSAWVMLMGAGVTLVLWATTRRRLAARGGFTQSLFAVLSSFAVGASLVFVLEGKDWFYHRIPAAMALILALLLWCAEILPQAVARRGHVPRWRLLPLACLALLVLVAFAATGMNRMRPWIEAAVRPGLSTEARLERIIRHQHAKTYIAFSEWIALGFPVVNNTGVVWTSRFDSMWALRGELWRAHQDGHAPAAWPIRHWVARDFIAGCPDIAVVDARGGINYMTVLVASEPDFARAWAYYHEIATLGGLLVYQRQGPGCANPAVRPRIASGTIRTP